MGTKKKGNQGGRTQGQADKYGFVTPKRTIQVLRTTLILVDTANNFLLLNNDETGVNDNVLLLTYKDPVLPSVSIDQDSDLVGANGKHSGGREPPTWG